MPTQTPSEPLDPSEASGEACYVHTMTGISCDRFAIWFPKDIRSRLIPLYMIYCLIYIIIYNILHVYPHVLKTICILFVYIHVYMYIYVYFIHIWYSWWGRGGSWLFSSRLSGFINSLLFLIFHIFHFTAPEEELNHPGEDEMAEMDS